MTEAMPSTPHILVAALLESILSKGAYHSTDVIVCGVDRLNRVPERSGLFRRWQQFQLCVKFHLLNITQVFITAT